MNYQDPDLLRCFRLAGRCEWCGRPGPVEPHHLLSRGMGGGGRLDVRCNLIALDRRCHDLVHWGTIPRKELLAVVARREGLTVDELQEQLWEMRRS